jgi:hypothetical protein
MSRRRLRRCTAWLLPLLAVRLLVPAGFMVSVSDGGLDIVLCSGFTLPSAQLSTGTSQQHPAGVDHALHALGNSSALVPNQGSEHTTHDNPICPFALASGGALCPADKGVAEPPRLVAVQTRLSADPAWVSPAVLTDRIRGPPVA